MKWDGLAENNSTAWFIEEDVGWSNPNVLRHFIKQHEQTGETGGLMTVTAGNMINDPYWYFWKQLTDNEHLFPALLAKAGAGKHEAGRRKSAHSHSFNAFCGLSGSLLAEIARFAERNGRLLFLEVLFINLCHEMKVLGRNCHVHIFGDTTPAKTIRYRPEYRTDELMALPPNSIVHPVKNVTLLLNWMKEYAT